MLNDDHMASTTTLQSHIPPVLEILDPDDNLGEQEEGEQISLAR